MISVVILINGYPIMARSAVNQKKENKKGETRYKVDTGAFIWHKKEDGAVRLAEMMLKTFKV